MGRVLLLVIILGGIISAKAQNRTFNLNEFNSSVSNDPIQGNDHKFEKAKKHRELRLNNRLQTPGLLMVNDTLVLDLFEGVSYNAYIDKIKVDVNNTYTIRARILGTNFGHCIISSSKGKSFITIDIPEKGEFYKTVFNHKTKQYHLLDVDKSKEVILEGAPSLIPPETITKPKKTSNQKTNEPSALKSPLNQTPLGDVATQDTVTLLIVYTPAAAAWSATNETDINNTISILMSKSQLVLDNSNTLLTLELVHSTQIEYTELHSNADLDNLTYDNDGEMDTVHYLRDTYCADVVVLLEETGFTGGLGWLYNAYSAYGFSLTRVQQASNTYTTIHEIGHNMGCHHHNDQNFQPGPGWFNDYSAGWRWTGTNRYCSVMTYQDGSFFADGLKHDRVPYFSSPLIQYEGIATGDAVNGDNARTIRELKGNVAAFRTGCYTPPETATNLLITDISYTNGDDECFGATDTIIVASDGNTVIFETGSTGNFAAGMSINFLPGFHAQTGSYINAYIDLTGTFCDPPATSIIYAENSFSKSQTIIEPNNPSIEKCKVYPNPNNGNFKVEISNYSTPVMLQLINSTGAILDRKTVQNGISEIDASKVKRGLYFLQIQSSNKTVTQKIIIQ